MTGTPHATNVTNLTSATPTRPKRRAALAVGIVVALALVTPSCADDDPATDTTGTGAGSTAAATTEPTTGAGTAGSSATATSGTATATTSSTLLRPPVPMQITDPDDGTSPNGSGCTPPPGDTLPDGIWFGLTRAVDPTGPTLSLDLACFFTGDAATKAAGRQPDDPIENGYFIKNENPKRYTLPLAEDVDVLRLQNEGGSTEFEPTGQGPAAAADATAAFGDSFLTWLAVSDGAVVVVQQQFVP